jgi:apolipoprotein N-acyltransferase
LIQAIAKRAATLAGWNRYGSAFLLGAVATLALPPISLFPLLFFVFPPLVWLLNGAKRQRSAFAVGWWFGFGFFAFGLYWTSNALLVFAAKFAWLLPFTIAGLPAFLALFSAAATLIAWLLQGSLNRAIGLALAWVAGEWLRGHILTGFPWNLIGYAWADNKCLMQLAALVGIYGVSLAVILSACLPAALVDHRSPWRIAAVAIALPLLIWIGGTLRLSNTPGIAYVDGVGLRIVQSNIPQKEKWSSDYQERNLRQFLELSHKNRPNWVTHVIWPETAATFFPSTKPRLLRALSAIVPAGGLLITGAPRRIDKNQRVANAMFALNETGRIVAHYDKFHLVPFGEYVPFANMLPIEKITHGKRSFTPGPGVRTIALHGLPPFSPLICYEVIFSGNVADRAQRPAWLLNLTNDAWYGVSAGPHQHLAHARVRAIEEGLPLIRAAYSGISAVIDPYGHILKTHALNEPGVIDTRLPRAVPAPPYTKLGDIPFGIILLLFGVILFLANLKNIAHNKQ